MKDILVHHEAHGRQLRFLQTVLGCLALAISLILVTSTLRLQQHPSVASKPASFPSPPSKRIACHPQEDEVQSARCIFDEMLNGWVPTECYDEALATDSLRNDSRLAMMQGAGRFPWYSDLQFTHPLSPDELPGHLLAPSANMTAFTLEKWHVAHCLYVWRLGLDALDRIRRGEKGVVVNVRVLDASHVDHCNMVIADQEHRRNAKATVTFGFGTCVQIT